MAMERERGAKNAAFKEQSQNKKIISELEGGESWRGDIKAPKSPNREIKEQEKEVKKQPKQNSLGHRMENNNRGEKKQRVEMGEQRKRERGGKRKRKHCPRSLAPGGRRKKGRKKNREKETKKRNKKNRI